MANAVLYRTLFPLFLHPFIRAAALASVTRPPELKLSRPTSLVSLEHVNLNVPSWTPELDAFWFDTLGFARDPRAQASAAMTQKAGGTMKGLVWANAGLQQIHMPTGEPAPFESQALAGVIGLAYQDLEQLRSDLQVGGVSFKELTVESEPPSLLTNISRMSAGALEFRSPTGVRLRAHALIADEQQHGAEHSADVGWFSPHGPIDPRTALTSGVGLPGDRPSQCMGVPYVQLLCAAGAAAGIGRFYREIFGVQAELRPINGNVACWVPIGADQWLVYEEAADARSIPYNGYHVAIYVNGFVEAYERARNLGLVWNNPRFPSLTYDTLMQALQHNEFRVLDMRDPESGFVVHTLEHEIRSLSHPGFSCRSWLKQPDDHMAEL